MNPTKCCKPDLYAWFKGEALYRIGFRHAGVYCAGRLDVIQKGPWFSRGRKIPTGEQIQLVAL